MLNELITSQADAYSPSDYERGKKLLENMNKQEERDEKRTGEGGGERAITCSSFKW